MVHRCLTKLVVLLLVLSLKTSVSLSVSIQDVDYTREEYEAYSACTTLDNSEDKQKCLLEFMQAHPKLSLVEYGISEYGRALNQQIKNGQHDKVVTAGEAMLKYRPNEINLITQLCYSSYNSGQYEKAAKYGELAYSNSNSQGFIKILTASYKEMGSREKYKEWAFKAIKDLDPSQSFSFVEEFRSSAALKENWRQAAHYSRKTLDFLSKMKPNPNTPKPEWNSWVRKQRSISYLLLGRNSYEGQNWASAVVNYQRVIRHSLDRNLRGESHYYIGMSNWKENRLQPAMEAFACGSRQKGSAHARVCENYLIRLYKSTHNGSTAGINEFKARAKGACG